MAALLTLTVGLGLGLICGHRLGRVAERTGTTAAERALHARRTCLACRVPVVAERMVQGTCGADRCVDAVQRGIARMDEARRVASEHQG